MNTNSRMLAYLISLCIIFAIAASQSQPGTTPNLTYTDNIDANLFPCNCGGVSAGGLARLASILSQQKAHGDLLIDCGNFTYGSDPIESIANDAVISFFNAMQYDVICLGRSELNLQIPAIASFLKTLDPAIPVVCTNLNPNSQLYNIGVKPFMACQIGDKRAIITAIVSDNDLLKSGMVVNAEFSLRSLVKHLPPHDILLCCTASSNDVIPALTDNSLVICIGWDSRLGKDDHGTVVFSKPVLPGNWVGGRSAVTMIVAEKPVDSITCDIWSNTPDVPEISEIAEMLTSHVLQKAQMYASYAEETTPSSDNYTGNTVCIQCHMREMVQWSNTKHSQGFDTIASKVIEGTLIPQSQNPDCLKCHTVAFSLGGRERRDLQLSDVGCEACHGPGKAHVGVMMAYGIEKEQGLASAFPADLHIRRKPDESVCVECHIQLKSPSFEFKSYYERIRHEKPNL
jgi:hypothetical protein